MFSTISLGYGAEAKVSEEDWVVVDETDADLGEGMGITNIDETLETYDICDGGVCFHLYVCDCLLLHYINMFGFVF